MCPATISLPNFARESVSAPLQRSLPELGKEMGLYHRYIYQNYADGDQDAFAGYGEENRERLRGIHKRFDPEGVFWRLQPGYFKV